MYTHKPQENGSAEMPAEQKTDSWMNVPCPICRSTHSVQADARDSRYRICQWCGETFCVDPPIKVETERMAADHAREIAELAKDAIRLIREAAAPKFVRAAALRLVAQQASDESKTLIPGLRVKRLKSLQYSLQQAGFEPTPEQAAEMKDMGVLS